MDAMDDKTLLELAAKAARIDAEWFQGEYSSEGMWLKGARSPDNNKMWNPLNDDGDALRLAVAVGLEFSSFYVCILHKFTSTYAFNSPTTRHWHDKDAYAGTRRAIVLAAAKIGQEL